MRWLLWCFCLLAESYETINHYPCMRVNSVGRGRRRGKRGVVRRILRRRRWRKGWGLRIHWRRLATLARCRSNTTIVACSTGNITSGQRRGATGGLYGEVSQHVSRLQTVNAYCASLAFPIDRVSFRTPTKNIPETRPWCIEKVTFVLIRQHDVRMRTREQRRFMCTFLKL